MRRRFRRPFIGVMTLTVPQLEMLAQANKFIADQQFGQAAPLFAELARQLEIGRHPRRAANLHAQAANAYAEGGNEAEALVQARAALNLFIQYQMVQRTPVFYANITRKLTRHGMKEAANALQAEFGGKVSQLPAPGVAAVPGLLPTTCPQCGAPVRNDEVIPVDANTVECGYCGALLRPGA
ncbi:MAG TPA: zinc ribbon domain-containing protein [Longilinea sp.]|nr:zinc ribbon domain-containing protein [Longilinea sp.]